MNDSTSNEFEKYSYHTSNGKEFRVKVADDDLNT